MKPIPTTDERIKNDAKFDPHDIDSRDTIVMQHLEAELLETQTQLKERLLQTPRALEHDLEILKTLKHEFVDRMIAAGIQYDTAGSISYLMNVMLGDLKDAVNGENAKL
jgi:hypothetical protein